MGMYDFCLLKKLLKLPAHVVLWNLFLLSLFMQLLLVVAAVSEPATVGHRMVVLLLKIELGTV